MRVSNANGELMQVGPGGNADGSQRSSKSPADVDLSNDEALVASVVAAALGNEVDGL